MKKCHIIISLCFTLCLSVSFGAQSTEAATMENLNDGNSNFISYGEIYSGMVDPQEDETGPGKGNSATSSNPENCISCVPANCTSSTQDNDTATDLPANCTCMQGNDTSSCNPGTGNPTMNVTSFDTTPADDMTSTDANSTHSKTTPVTPELTQPPKVNNTITTILYECSMKTITSCKLDFGGFNFSPNSSNSTWTIHNDNKWGAYLYFNGSDAFSGSKTEMSVSLPVQIKDEKSSTVEISFRYKLGEGILVNVSYERKCLWNTNTSTNGSWVDVLIKRKNDRVTSNETRHKRSAGEQMIKFSISKRNESEELSPDSGFSLGDIKVKRVTQKPTGPAPDSPDGSGLGTTTILAISVPCGAFVLVVIGAFVYRLTHSQEQSKVDPNDDPKDSKSHAPSSVNYDEMAVFYQEHTYEGILRKVEALKSQKALEKIL